MSDQPENNGTLVNLKRVRVDEVDHKDRSKSVFTFGLVTNKKTGATQNTAVDLANAINALASEGKQINLDFRVYDQQDSRGRKFKSGFLLVKEMVPKDQQQAVATVKPSLEDQIKAKAKQIEENA